MVNRAVDYADLLITIGYNTVEFPASVSNKDLQKKILDINFTSSFQDIYNPPICELAGDIGAALRILTGQLRGYQYDGSYFARLKSISERIAAMSDKKAVPTCKAPWTHVDIVKILSPLGK